MKRKIDENQLSIFDFLSEIATASTQPEEEVIDLETVDEKTVVDIISQKLGKPFQYNSHCNRWESSKNGATADIYMGRYVACVNNGRRFISVGVSNNLSGFGGPCDSIEEATESIRDHFQRYMKKPKAKKAA